jgi:hypothetical protein
MIGPPLGVFPARLLGGLFLGDGAPRRPSGVSGERNDRPLLVWMPAYGTGEGL